MQATAQTPKLVLVSADSARKLLERQAKDADAFLAKVKSWDAGVEAEPANSPLAGLAARVFMAMKLAEVNQSIIFRGIDAADKNSAIHQFIQHIVVLSTKKARKVHSKMLAAVVVLSAFGNVKTEACANSNRFGHFSEIQFDERQKVVGFKTLEYLLEKERVTDIPSGERSFHAFYYLLAGATPEQRSQFKLHDLANFDLLKAGQRVLDKSDTDGFGKLSAALKTLGLSKKSQHQLFQLMAAILHLGNIQFVDVRSHNSEQQVTQIKNHSQLTFVANLLGLEQEQLQQTLLSRTTMVGRDLCTIVLDPIQAAQHRNALAQALYALLFTWLVEYINSRLNSDNVSNIISVVEFPGSASQYTREPTFWNFCTNLVEERLNFFSLDCIRRIETEQFGAEGIQVPLFPTGSENNSDLLQTLHSSTSSVVAALNTASQQLKPDIADFMSAVSRINSKYIKALNQSTTPSITIKHTVTPDPVTYPVASYIDDNLNLISSDFITLFRGNEAQPSSTNEFVCGLFSSRVIGNEAATDKKKAVDGHVPGKPLRRPTLKRRKDNKSNPPPITSSTSKTVLSELDISLTELIEETLADMPTWFVFNTVETSESGIVSTQKQHELLIAPALLRHLTVLPNHGNHFVRIPYTKLLSRYAYSLITYNIDESRTPPDRINGLFHAVGISVEGRVLGRESAFISWHTFILLERDLKKAKGIRRAQGKGADMSDDDDAYSVHNNGRQRSRKPSISASFASNMDGGDKDALLKRPKPAFMNWDDAASYISDDDMAASDSQSVYDAFNLQNSVYNGHSGSGADRISPNFSNGGKPSTKSIGASHLEKVHVHDPFTDRDAIELIDVKPGQASKIRYEKPVDSPSRKRWLGFVWLVTWWVPSLFLSTCGRMKEKHIQMAWREKLAICLLIFVFSAVVLFLIVGVSMIVCPRRDVYTPQEVEWMADIKNKIYVSAYGSVYNLAQVSNAISDAYHSRDQMAIFAGVDISTGLSRNPRDYCSLVTDDIDLIDGNKNSSGAWAGIYAQHKSYIKTNPDIAKKIDGILASKTFIKGAVVYDRKDIIAGWDQPNPDEDNQKRIIIDQVVYDLSMYYYSIKRNNNAKKYRFLQSSDLSTPDQESLELYLQRDTNGRDFTNDDTFMTLWRRSPELRTCFNNLFRRGVIDYRTTPQCLFADYILLAMSCVLCFLILMKFLSALQLGNGGQSPDKADKFVMIQVPCYTESEESLTKTINSLTTTKYDDKRKLMVIICDGMIVGRGNEKPTPQIVLDILGVDPVLDPEPLSCQAIGEGNKQHNLAKIYSGLYEYEGHLAPYVVIVKVGKPSEGQRPGNRGKRDSQMLLMRFLNKVHYDYPMSPFELEMRHHIQNIIGVDPKWYEYMLMVDADTTVYPDSLSKLVSFCMTDTSIVGCCGETRLLNEKDTMITMIQVYEYFISHHLSKAFESLFGSVTCLPGCFCMYRIFSPIKNKPLLAHDNIVRDYSDVKVNTLHKKNLLSLGEDRYLTTLMLKHFPQMRTKFTPAAMANTFAPESFSVLLSQRRRWINSTFHNLFELMWLKELCGFCCFSMRFVIFIDLIATIIMPATVVYLIYLIYLVIDAIVKNNSLDVVMMSLILLAAIYGLQAIVFIVRKEFSHVIWMIIYLLAIPVFGFAIPIYSFWHMDDFSWGNTRKIIGEKGEKVVVCEEDEYFDIKQIKHMKWSEWETNYMETRSVVSQHSHRSGVSRRSEAAPNRFSGVSDENYMNAFENSQQSTYFNETLVNPRQSMMSNAHTTQPMYPQPSHQQFRMSMASNQEPWNGAANNAGMRSSVYSMPPTMATLPSDDELVFKIQRILSTADLMKITKKQVRDEMSALFSVDLTARKDFINHTIDMVLEEYAN